MTLWDHENKKFFDILELRNFWQSWSISPVLKTNSSAMARNPIVESPKFGEILLTFTVHVKKYIEIVQIEGLYTLINNV